MFNLFLRYLLMVIWNNVILRGTTCENYINESFSTVPSTYSFPNYFNQESVSTPASKLHLNYSPISYRKSQIKFRNKYNLAFDDDYYHDASEDAYDNKRFTDENLPVDEDIDSNEIEDLEVPLKTPYYDKVDDFHELPDRRVTLNEDDNSFDSKRLRATLSLGYIAFLYNSKMPERKCVGAIITPFWILDHCDDFPGYKYDLFEVGSARDAKNRLTYTIKESIRHDGYRRIDFKTEKFDARFMFAAQNALFLHRSSATINIIPGLVYAITVHSKTNAPSKASALYLKNGEIKMKTMRISKNTDCNDRFKLYFGTEEQLLLDDSNLCGNTIGLHREQCCNSQTILVADNKLLGLMSWSTGCFEKSIDPWVFSKVGYYINWIKTYVHDLE